MAHKTPPQKIKIAKAICDKYATGKYTIASCCDSEGLSEKQFLNWGLDIPEISDMYERAKQLATEYRKNDLKVCALNSLRRLVEGFEYEETHQEGKPMVNEKGIQTGITVTMVKKVKKTFAPNPTAVIFTLKSLEPTTFRDGLPEVHHQEQVFMIGGKEIKF